MLLVSDPVSKQVVLEKHNTYFETMIKAVVDVRKEVIALDAELHADLECMLLDEGSQQEDIWGVNFFLDKEKENWIEYTALINLRPSMDNRSMDVQDPEIRQKITQIVNRLIME